MNSFGDIAAVLYTYIRYVVIVLAVLHKMLRLSGIYVLCVQLKL